jgi:hypothetical protein
MNLIYSQSRSIARAVMLGAFYLRKALNNQTESGTRQAARNLRKQGVPLSIALAVLCGQFEERRDPQDPFSPDYKSTLDFSA